MYRALLILFKLFRNDMIRDQLAVSPSSFDKDFVGVAAGSNHSRDIEAGDIALHGGRIKSRFIQIIVHKHPCGR
ncbi:hypothetical protein D3C79_973240 [compost metagenome]